MIREDLLLLLYNIDQGDLRFTYLMTSLLLHWKLVDGTMTRKNRIEEDLSATCLL